MHAANGRRILKAAVPTVVSLLGAILAVGLASGYPLTRAAFQSAGDEVVMRLEGPADLGSIPHDVFCLDQPWRVVIDLFGADAPVALGGLEAIPAGPVAAARSSLWKADPAGTVVRYVLETTGPTDYRVEEAPGELRVHLRPAGTSPAEPGLLPESQDQAPDLGPVDPSSPRPEEPAGMAEAVTPVAPVPPPAPSDLAEAQPSSAPPETDKPPAAPIRAMNLDVQGADLRTVIRSIAEFSGTNIVPDREIEGPVSVRLIQVPWRQALDIVCQSAGLIALEGDGIIRVATLRAWRDEGIEKESSDRKKEDLQPLATRIFTVRYASAKELKDAVSFVLSKRGSAQVDERTNALLINDIESRLTQVEALVSSLDTETRQVEIVARLVDVDQTAARQLGIDWSLNNLHSNSERISGSAGVTEPLTASSGSVRLGVVRGFGNLDATIEALERSNKAHLISNPKITTVNNRKARILVGKEVPLIVLDQAGNPVTELKKVGITLEVTPYINTENRITMDLHPEVSDLSSQATVQGGLIFTTTLADTRVMVNNGETAVIGGLVRTSETTFEQGIPILRSIPLLGALFRQTDVRRESRELLIFVSPTVTEKMASR